MTELAIPPDGNARKGQAGEHRNLKAAVPRTAGQMTADQSGQAVAVSWPHGSINAASLPACRLTRTILLADAGMLERGKVSERWIWAALAQMESFPLYARPSGAT